MDFFVLIWVAFVLFSIVRAVRQQQQKEAEARARHRPPPLPSGLPPALPEGPAPLPGGEYRTASGQVLAPHQVVLEPAPAPAQPDPFADWGAWPGEASTWEGELDEPEPQEGLVPAESGASVEVMETPKWHAGLEEISQGHGVVSLEPTVVDWTKEHEKFHQRYVDQVGTPMPATHRTLDVLRDPGALRKAVLLAEVLGPPRALRPHDPVE